MPYRPIFIAPSKLPLGTQLDLIVRRSTCDDPIEIGWIALRFQEALPAAGGAASPVGKARPTPAVMRSDDCLRRNRHLMDCPVREVGDLLRVTYRELGGSADVSGIRG